MENIVLLMVLMFVNFILISLAYKYFGKEGLFIYIVLSAIAANVQVNKFVHYAAFNLPLLGKVSVDATLGNVMFGGIFLATDLLNEKYGPEEAKKSVILSVCANVAFVIVMVTASFFSPLNDEFTMKHNDAYQLLFSINGNVIKAVVIGNMVYVMSQFIDIKVYSYVKSKLPEFKYLFVRNNLSTMISQTIDTLVLTFLFCLAKIISFDYFWPVSLATLIIKMIVAVTDTPFLYIMNLITPKKDVVQRERLIDEQLRSERKYSTIEIKS